MRQVRVHAGHVRCVAYSPDGKLLATASNDRTVRLLDAVTGEMRATWAITGGVLQAVAFSPDGGHLAWGGQLPRLGVAQLHSAPLVDEPVPLALDAYGLSITAAAFAAADTVLVAIGDRILKPDLGGLFLYRLGTGWRSPNLTTGVSHLALRADRRRVAMVTADGLCFADAPTWKPDDPLGGGYSMAVAYSPDGKTLAAAHGWKAILLDAETYEVRHELAHHGRVTSVAFTPDGRTLLTGSWDRTVGVWSVASGARLAALDWGRGKVQYVAAAPDGMTAAAACDKGVVIWDLD
jgi:WD40 repeat protein